MSTQGTTNSRTVRVRSCKKRSFIGDVDSSSEVENLNCKKSKTLFKTVSRTPKSNRKSPKTSNEVQTAAEKIVSATTKTPKEKGRAQKVSARKTESIDKNFVLEQSEEAQNKKPAGHCPLLENSTFEQKDTWPHKYSPSSFGVFVGNKIAVEKVDRWLTQWKTASKKNVRKEPDSSSSSFVYEETSSSALFIKGPPGVGKTSLVYYLAKRLGFTVLEVNSSSERPGKRVLADLQEATQSQHVEGTKVSIGGINAFFKPTLTQSPANPVTTSQIPASKGRKKSRIQTVVKEKKGTLKKFFFPVANNKPDQDATAQAEDVELEEVEKSPKLSIKSFFAPKKAVEIIQDGELSRCRSESPEIITKTQTVEKSDDRKIKCSNSTIILFDDVDVIFDDDGDEGFWMALETVLKSTKKPCILTATRGYEGVVKRCKSLQNAPLVELHRPSPSHVASLVSEICEAENRDLTDYNVEFMCQYLASDVRRSLIQMEFETISSGLLQTVHPANRTMGALMTSGSIEDALEIQIGFKKVGFNALYASLEDCLPFEFENILLDTTCNSSLEALTPKRASKFEVETIKDFSRLFDEFSTNDLFVGFLSRMGEKCLPSYERAKRWMKQHPFEDADYNSRVVEEVFELSSTLLLGKSSMSLERISERFANLDLQAQSEHRLPKVENTLGFRDIHKQLKKVRISESCLVDVLEHFPIRQSTAFEYLNYMNLICRAENDKREKSRRGNRFNHYFSHVGVFFGPEQLTRISDFW